MALKIIKAGLSTTIQDLGRPGYFHLGIPEGGAMDQFAFRVANMLVGNPESAAGLEAVFMGPEIEFLQDGLVAVTGAEMPIFLDGEAKESWTSFYVRKGQILSFDFLKTGARIYIAFAGGIDTPEALGSRSTYPIGALGGVNGRAITLGDELPVGDHNSLVERSIDKSLIRLNKTPVVLRVLSGLYDYLITPESKKRFFSEEWTVAPEADRMGYRFRGGSKMEFVKREQPFGAGSDPSNIVDGCYPYGSIQVPGGSEPIVLHRDAVSGGGYFTLGAVISADMDLIGQLQPNSKVRFVEVDMNEALAARKENNKKLNDIRHILVR